MSGLRLYDDVTIALVLGVLTVYAVKSILRPNPLAHPLLLGRQSDVARVRNAGESASYRNYGVGHGAFLPSRPSRRAQTVIDLLPDDVTGARTLWTTKTSNAELRELANAFASGLIRTLHLTPTDSKVLLLLNDDINWVVADLALASHSIKSLTLAHLNTLSYVLTNHLPNAIVTHMSFLDQLLELLVEEDSKPAIIVVGDRLLISEEKGKKAGIRVLRWEEVESFGGAYGKLEVEEPKPTDVFTTSFYTDSNGHAHGVQLTHENVTAGVTSIRSMFTQSAPLSPESVVQSAQPLSSPYGRGILYTALYEGSSFTTLESASVLNSEAKADVSEIIRATASTKQPKPTHVFATSAHVKTLASTTLSHAKSSILYPLLWRHKLSHFTQGYVKDDSMWDVGFFGVLGKARQKALGWDDKVPWIKAIVSSEGPLEVSTLPETRIALSIPLTNAYTIPLSTAPIFASHPFDLQHFPQHSVDGNAHVGAPGANVEVKLIGVDDAAIEQGADPKGEILVRGPTIGSAISSAATPAGLYQNPEDNEEHWVKTGLVGLVQSSGTFKILN